jgi:hypothetical protein
LYGGHLALNHLIIAENFNIGFGRDLLDQGVTSRDPTDIDKHIRLHLHCWHGDQDFSKFSFKAGKYDMVNASTLINDTSAYGYVCIKPVGRGGHRTRHSINSFVFDLSILFRLCVQQLKQNQ